MSKYVSQPHILICMLNIYSHMPIMPQDRTSPGLRYKGYRSLLNDTKDSSIQFLFGDGFWRSWIWNR